MRFIAFIFFLLIATLAFGQLHIQPASEMYTPSKVIKRYIGSGIQVTNIRFNGDTLSLATYIDEKGTTGFDTGIIISNGLAEQAVGPNGRGNSGANFGHYFFTDKDLKSKHKMCDGVVIEFDFVPKYDSIVFPFVFASDEYPEFVGEEFNDLFGFYLKTKSAANMPSKNLAKLANGTRVTVNNVNSEKNSEWYIPNNQHQCPNYQLIEYDGFTKPIIASAIVVAGKPYHFKIVIADVSDCEYDSSLFLKLRSFSSVPRNKINPHQTTKSTTKKLATN